MNKIVLFYPTWSFITPLHTLGRDKTLGIFLNSIQALGADVVESGRQGHCHLLLCLAFVDSDPVSSPLFSLQISETRIFLISLPSLTLKLAAQPPPDYSCRISGARICLHWQEPGA
jgi:hypothetical protein